LFASGFLDMPPCNAPGYLAHDCASVYGALGAVAALLDRERREDGLGQLVEISVQEAALAGTIPWSIAIQDYAKLSFYLPVEGTRNAEGAYWVLPASDGWVRTVMGSPRQWNGFVKLLRDPDALLSDEWQSQAFRLMNADVVRIVAEERLTDRTRAELFDEARELGTTIGVLHTVREFVDHPQTKARSYFDFESPGLEGLPLATYPATFSRPQVDVAAGASSIGKGRNLLLEGVRVVEFGGAAVVPELCGVLSELGAEVIKIESLAHPDVLRMGSGDINKVNLSFAFNCECRGRRSVALDLTTERGRELALELCASADVVAENNRGGVMDALELGYEAVRARNPRVIYASSQGYGRGGPFGEMPAYGPLNSGFNGTHLLWNHPDAPYPCGTSLNHPDHIAGKLLAVAVLAALREREVSGKGQWLQQAQTEAGAYLIGERYLEAVQSGRDPQPLGNTHPTAVVHGVFRSGGGDDEWIAIAVIDDAGAQRLAEVIGDTPLETWTAERTSVEAAESLQANGVSAMPVMGPKAHCADPHLAERGFIVTLHHAEVGDERHVGNPIRMSRLPQRTAASAPQLGIDTEEVLTSVLGLTPNDVRVLVDEGVCR
jgi:crotonobetainyl-CoA:carnitine CoA-transferase CaiB-like acyl-CoA transferase